MTADATLFSNNDLTEPGYGGQVVATTRPGSGCFSQGSGFDSLTFDTPIHDERRLFINKGPHLSRGEWVDSHGNIFKFRDLRDIVILNRGEK